LLRPFVSIPLFSSVVGSIGQSNVQSNVQPYKRSNPGTIDQSDDAAIVSTLVESVATAIVSTIIESVGQSNRSLCRR
jgi:hypothetical protein